MSQDPYMPPQDWTGGPERIQACEETPISLTTKQRERLWMILRDELGPHVAIQVLSRIEAEA